MGKDSWYIEDAYKINVRQVILGKCCLQQNVVLDNKHKGKNDVLYEVVSVALFT